MLHRKERVAILIEAFKNVKRKFYMNILVTFIIAVIIAGGYQFATDNNSRQADGEVISTIESVDTDSNNYLFGSDSNDSNATIINQFVANLFDMDNVQDSDAPPSISKKYYNGVGAVFVNEITGSQSFIFGIVNGLNVLIFQGKISNSIVIFVFAILSAFVFVFVKNVIVVGEKRYFLEQRRYHGTGPREIFFPYKNKRLRHVSRVMFFRYLFQVLWNMTIVGGFIKHYEYLLIPYIMAENPSTPQRKAFEISRKLMHGEKWKTFLLDMTLLPLEFLSYFTFNLSKMFFTDAFEECVYAEVYMRLRNAKKEALELGLRKYLNDDLLAIEHIEEGEHPSGIEVLDIPTLSIHDLSHNYNRKYSLISLVQLFFTYSLVGYLWEVVYHLATQGSLVNRGTMHGPWLPIYGCGGLLIILLLKPLREKPGWLFVGAFGVCGVVEYFTAWALETFLHKKWWDYEGFFLNIDGRVCLEGLLVFGLAGLAFTYVFSPILDDMFQKMKMKHRKIICAILIVLFLADLVWSVISPNTGAGITM